MLDETKCSTWKVISRSVLAGLFVVAAGCSQVRPESSKEYPTLQPEVAKARSIEIQHEVMSLIPEEYLTGNDLPSIDADIKHVLYKCSPILSEDYSRDETVLVQYPGMFAVSLDVGAPLEEVAEVTYKSTARELGLPETDVDAELSGFYYPPIETEDGYSIIISLAEVDNSPKDQLAVDVWSPCFIPEGGALPPGGKI